MEKFSAFLVLVTFGLCQAQDHLDGLHCFDFDCSALMNGVCLDGICRCKPGFYDPGTRICSRRLKANENCTIQRSHYQCLDNPYATCKDVGHGYVCHCDETTHFSEEDRCKKRILPGFQCNSTISDTNQCVNNATCQNTTETCECEKSYFNDGGSCEQRKDINDTCLMTNTDLKQCVDHAHCHEGKCVCDPGFYSANTITCSPSKNLTDRCDGKNDLDRLECADQHASCRGQGTNKTCDCDDDYYRAENNTICEKRKSAGAECDQEIEDTDKQCVDNASCEEHHSSKPICVCKANFLFDEGNCTAVTTPSPGSTSWTIPPPLDELIG